MVDTNITKLKPFKQEIQPPSKAATLDDDELLSPLGLADQDSLLHASTSKDPVRLSGLIDTKLLDDELLNDNLIEDSPLLHENTNDMVQLSLLAATEEQSLVNSPDKDEQQ